MAEEFWPNCECKLYSKAAEKTKENWHTIQKSCRGMKRRDLEIKRLTLRYQRQKKAGNKSEMLVSLREIKRLKEMTLPDYIAEKGAAKLARVGANSGGRRSRRRTRRRTRRRRRRRTRRKRGRGTDKFGRNLGTKRKRDADIRRRRNPTVATIQAAYTANLRNRWGAAAAESRAKAKTKAFTKEMEGLGLTLKNLTFTRGRKSPKSSPKSSKRKSIKKKGGGRRRTRRRRRRGGMNIMPPPKAKAKPRAGWEAEAAAAALPRVPDHLLHGKAPARAANPALERLYMCAEGCANAARADGLDEALIERGLMFAAAEEED